MQLVWQYGLIGTGICGLLGLAWKGRPSTGLGIELAGILTLGSFTLTYAIALLVGVGVQAITPIVFNAGVAVGSFWRSAEITGDLIRLARAHPLPTTSDEGYRP